MAASYDEREKPSATLHILLRDGSVTERSLGQEESLIGKGSHNDIILADASVSHTHAKIAWADYAYTLTDLGSRNGTFLNDVKISEPRQLKNGDRIKLGHCLLTFQVSEIEPGGLMTGAFNIPTVDLKTIEVDSGAAALLGPQFLRENLVCPLAEASADSLPIAIADPTDQERIAEIERITHKKAALRPATPGEITGKLDNYFSSLNINKKEECN